MKLLTVQGLLPEAEGVTPDSKLGSLTTLVEGQVVRASRGAEVMMGTKAKSKGRTYEKCILRDARRAKNQEISRI